MMPWVTFLICSAVILAVRYFFKLLKSYRAFHIAASKYGCQHPEKYPHRDFWGYDLVKERTAAVKDGRQMELYMEHFYKYGKTWEEKFFDVKMINTMESRNIQQVAALGFQDYGKPPTNLFLPFLGRGIFSANGAEWKHSRDLVKPIFSRSELSDIDAFSFHVERFLDLIPRDGSTIDLQGSLHKLFLDSSSEFLFGKSMESLLPNDPNGSAEFLKAFNASLAGVGKRRLAGKLSPIKFAFDKSWKEAYDKVHAYIDVHVQRALDETSNEIKDQDTEKKSQTRYILLHEMAKQIRDPIELRFQILNVFLPGRDTTSILMANTLFHLARNPQIWNQLRAESMALGETPLTFGVLKSLQLFKHVIYETLRLQGPSGRVQRQAIRDTILPVGGGPDGKAPVFVEKGKIVAMNLWGLGHDRDIWGDDVDEFNPQRWVDKRPLWEFVPFLGGPRICPAQQQVLTQTTYLLARMTREFVSIENRDPVEKYVELVKMTTESRNGVKVAFHTSTAKH